MPDQPAADPVLRHLVFAVNQAHDVSIPISLSVHGSGFVGELISQVTYFAALTEDSPLLAALDPTSPLAADQYAADSSHADDEFLHVRVPSKHADLTPPVWRMRLAAVDGWSLRLAEPDDDEAPRPAPGVFALLFGRDEH
jgi:hypothetical protein